MWSTKWSTYQFHDVRGLRLSVVARSNRIYKMAKSGRCDILQWSSLVLHMAKMDDPVNVPFNLLYLLCFESELFYSLPLKSSFQVSSFLYFTLFTWHIYVHVLQFVISLKLLQVNYLYNWTKCYRCCFWLLFRSNTQAFRLYFVEWGFVSSSLQYRPAILSRKWVWKEESNTLEAVRYGKS